MHTVVLALAAALFFMPVASGGQTVPGQPGQGQPSHGHPGHRVHGGQNLPTVSPYAGMESQEVKSLSPEEAAGLRAGEGLGMTLAAELNGYPGPRHVLQLAEPLGLDVATRKAVESIFDAMQAEAVALGERAIEAEAFLERLFANRTADEANVTAATAEAARLRGDLRAAHLRYHVRVYDLLTAEQRAAYDRLRGYVGR